MDSLPELLAGQIKQIDDQVVALKRERQELEDRLTTLRAPFPVGSVIEWDYIDTAAVRRGTIVQVKPWLEQNVMLITKALDKQGNPSEGTVKVLPYMNPRLAPKDPS